MLCLVTDPQAARGDLAAAVAAAVRGGVDWVQVRARALDGVALLGHAEEIAARAREAAAARGQPVRILVNRRMDVALAIGADGVHLGFDAVDPRTARELLGADALVGVSTHSAEELCVLARSGVASYAHLAPIFAPLSKRPDATPLGVGAVATAAHAGLPVLAQGGVDAGNASRLRAAGAAGIAVTGAVLTAPDPETAAAHLRSALDPTQHRGRS